MKVKKNLSVDDTLLSVAEKRAKELHLSFAAYITMLVNQDLSNMSALPPVRQHKKELEDAKDLALTQDVLNSIDAIMNIA
jgi:hypothetical protein